jgi:hypothetical protein
MILLSQLAPSERLLGMKSKRRTISLADFISDEWLEAFKEDRGSRL